MSVIVVAKGDEAETLLLAEAESLTLRMSQIIMPGLDGSGELREVDIRVVEKLIDALRKRRGEPVDGELF